MRPHLRAATRALKSKRTVPPAWALSASGAVNQQLPAHPPVAAKNRVGDRKLTAAVLVRLM
jgi:hypothetical protein